MRASPRTTRGSNGLRATWVRDDSEPAHVVPSASHAEPDTPALSAPTTARSSAASSPSASTRSPRSPQAWTLPLRRSARRRRYDHRVSVQGCDPAREGPQRHSCGPFAVPRAGNSREQRERRSASPSVFAGFPRVPGCSRTTNVSGRQDLNLRPPGPQLRGPGIAGFGWAALSCGDVRSVALSFAQFGPRIGPRASTPPLQAIDLSVDPGPLVGFQAPASLLHVRLRRRRARAY
jgi:hypothetical protein